MRVGVVILPQQRWAEAAATWRRAEELGFDHAWTYDHLSWRSLRDEPWFATVPTLVAAATVTSTIGLGTWVASPNYRHPVPFAKELMSLDDISGGRFVLGVGSGGAGFDATVLGHEALSPRDRARRFEDFVTLLDLLLRQPATTWRGHHYAAHEARMVPGGPSSPRLPFAVAANGPRGMALAARLGDGWVTTGPPREKGDDGPDALEHWWRGVGQMCARFDRARDAAGRRRGEPRRYLSVDVGRYALASLDVFLDTYERAHALGFTDVVTHWPRPDGVYAGEESVLEAVADRLPGLR
ncbi:LLM class flavin-dependent oxidoreductase [Aquipuribacter nitratireducens]|uniref:LLM class flavin-dependent oxidoreductase n=1 Tax=Aquipuribacter nitratireducens TaxID=650104 RepID=A0ABW0GMX7_9MICO